MCSRRQGGVKGISSGLIDTQGQPYAEANRVTAQKNKLSGSYAEYAEFFGCNPRTIQRERKAGAPLDDLKAMSAWFASRHSAPEGAAKLGGAAAALQLLRIEKLRLETQRLKILNALETGELVPIARVQGEITRLGVAYRSELEQFGAEILRWEGTARAEMERKVQRKSSDLLARLEKDLAGAIR
jgi:hypothetical protein